MKYIFPAVFYLLLRTVICADNDIAAAGLTVNEAEERQLQTRSSSTCFTRSGIIGLRLATAYVKSRDLCQDLCAARDDCAGLMTSTHNYQNRGHLCVLMRTRVSESSVNYFESALISCTGRAFKCFQRDIVYWGPVQHVENVSSVDACYTKCQERKGCISWSVEKIDRVLKCVQSSSIVYQKPGNGWISGSMDCNANGLAPLLQFYLGFINSSTTICEQNIGQPGTLIEEFIVEEVEYCLDLCALNPNCKLWFVAYVNTPKGKEIKCSHRGNLTLDEAKIATLRHGDAKACTDRNQLYCLENNMKYWSQDMQMEYASSTEMCYRKCRGLQWCKFFSFVLKTTECWQFKSVLYKTTTNGWISGAMGTNCVRPTVTLDYYTNLINGANIMCEADGKLSYHGTEIASLTVKEVKHCQDLCAVSNCKIWIIIETLPNGEGYKCSLRTSGIDESLIQSLKHFPGQIPCTTRNHSCIEPVKYTVVRPQIRANARTVYECYKTCLREVASCKVFVFQKSLAKCFTSTTQRVDSVYGSGFVSGSMNCGASESTAWKAKLPKTNPW